mmetsp:Transcript_153674/g.492626  ORF Transcript_153674/g.492626 Transcript_153674/m.492626 type:complete len:992 (-) Transcript_153674:69-3044(-)
MDGLRHAGLLVGVLALVIGCLHSWEVSCWHHALNSLSVPEQKVVGLKTENAFYYSFYEEVVLAPSLGEALRCVLQDQRSEAPDTINAVQRFNIYQEVICGLLYRFLKETIGERVLPDPWYFFRGCSYALQGFGHCCLALLASSLGGGGLRGGLAPILAQFCWLFLHRKDTGRIFDVGMLNLRENWAMPVMYWQVLALQRLLSSHPSLGSGASRLVYLWWLWSFRISTLSCILLWQFSAFAFVLQVAAVFLCTLLWNLEGPRRALLDVVKSHLMCTACAAVLLFGNDLLIHHMLVTECLAIWAVLVLHPKPPSWRLLFWLDGALAVVIFLALRLLQSRWATAEEHIAEIFIAKIRKLYPSLLGADQREPTFNARLYFAVSVFDFIDWGTIMMGVPTKVYHFAGAGAAVGALAFSGAGLSGSRARHLDRTETNGIGEAAVIAGAVSKKLPKDGLRRRKVSEKSEAEAADAPLTADEQSDCAAPSVEVQPPGAIDASFADAFGYGVFLAQIVLLLALGCFISRLKVLGTPFLITLAAVAAAPRPLEVLLSQLWSRCCAGQGSSRVVRSGLFIALALLQCGQLAFLARCLPFLGRGTGTHQEMFWSDGERAELYAWVTRRLPPDTTVVTSMPLSAELRLNTPVRLVIHPQFEAKHLRARVQELYEFYMCTPPERLASSMRKYRASYIVLEYKRCDFSPFILDERKEFNCAKGERPWKELFCPAAHVSPHFKLLFANAGYAVFELQDRVSTAGRAKAIEDIGSWKDMLDRCMSEDPDLCLSRVAELAVMFGSKIGQPQISQAMLQWAEERGTYDAMVQYIVGYHYDYNLKRDGDAAKRYKKAHQLAPNSGIITREYLMWLDLVAKDNRSIEALMRPRRFSKGTRKSFLDVGSVAVACEASVSARDLFRDQDWAEDLWNFAVEESIGHRCVKTNWPIFNKGAAFDDSIGQWGIFANIFLHRRMRSELSSMASIGVRFEHPRPAWDFGLAASFAARRT